MILVLISVRKRYNGQCVSIGDNNHN